jgi:signal peptidase I
VVTFRQGDYRRVARVVAMGGDEVSLGENGTLIVNGNVQDEEIFYVTEPLTGGEIQFPYTVPEDSYFVLCDYRTNSRDSRYFGAVSKNDIDGKIISFLRIRGI